MLERWRRLGRGRGRRKSQIPKYKSQIGREEFSCPRRMRRARRRRLVSFVFFVDSFSAEPVPPHEGEHISDVLPHFHFRRAGFAVITQVHWRLAEFEAGQ